MIEIIEDCSPYFIRYKHTGSDEIIQRCRQLKAEQIDSITEPRNKFLHHRLPVNDGLDILNRIPHNDQFKFIDSRVSLFVFQPGVYYRPHKDGLDCTFGINYIVDVKDSKCVTSWYSDEQFAGRPIDNLAGKTKSREIADYNRREEWNKIIPVKSMVARQDEVILFNTDIFHDVNNYNSPNERTILTLRTDQGYNMNFFDARKILFGY
jgi:hypothetical protein